MYFREGPSRERTVKCYEGGNSRTMFYLFVDRLGGLD